MSTLLRLGGSIFLMTALATALAAGPAAAQNKELPATIPGPAAPAPAPATCTSVTDFINTNCPLTWHGLTFYGTIDVGGAWQSHGVRFNRYSVQGIEQLVSKNSNHALWNLAPNGLSQSNIGIKGVEELAPGLSFIFDLEAGFDPYSFQLSNGPRSLVSNNGVPLNKQNGNSDSSRAGQFYNALGYAGASSTTYGTLTVGRQNSLTLDAVVAYDPMGGSNDFSLIGYSSATAGTGNTEAARYTTSVKYRVNIGQFRVAALGQFGGYEEGNGSTGSYQFGVGGDFLGGSAGKLSADAIYSHVDNVVSLAGLSASQNLKFPGTLAATISNNTSEMFVAKYTYGAIRAFAGYEHILFENPSEAQTTFSSLGDYTVLTANINNTAYTANKTLHVVWAGARYAITPKVDVGAAYYQYIQENFAAKSCSNTSSSKCHGTLNAISFDAVWKVTPKVDAYGGVMFSQVNGGLASGYLHRTSADPAAGLRFRF